MSKRNSDGVMKGGGSAQWPPGCPNFSEMVGMNMHDKRQACFSPAELKAKVQSAPTLSVSAYGKYKRTYKLLPIIVSFWDREMDNPWQGVVSVASLEDDTPECQAAAMFETIFKVLEFPPDRFLICQGDDSATEPGEADAITNLLGAKQLVLQTEMQQTKAAAAAATGAAAAGQNPV